MILMKNDSGREVVIFTEALKLPFHERGTFLQDRCDGNEPLRRKIDALLKAHDRLGDFMEVSPARQRKAQYEPPQLEFQSRFLGITAKTLTPLQDSDH